MSLHYPGTGPEHVLSCVPNEGIFITMTALLAPGDVVVAMYPGGEGDLRSHQDKSVLVVVKWRQSRLDVSLMQSRYATVICIYSSILLPGPVLMVN